MSDFVSVKDVCEQLSVSRWTVIRAIKSDQLKGAVKVTGAGSGGLRGTWRIPVSSYKQWVHSNSKPGAADVEGR